MIFKDFTLWTPPLQIKLLDVIPQIDLKHSGARWSRYSEGHLQNLTNYKERRVSTSIFPLVDTNGSVKEIDLVPPWTRTFAVVKDQVLSCLTRNF
jgi:hypothetical protein